MDAAGREYLKWVLSGAPAGAVLEVSFDDGVTWYPTTRTADTVSVLVAGPAAEANPAGTVVLAVGVHTAMVRLADTPEVVIRDGGRVHIT
jgi:hypothetical protein